MFKNWLKEWLKDAVKDDKERGCYVFRGDAFVLLIYLMLAIAYGAGYYHGKY